MQRNNQRTRIWNGKDIKEKRIGPHDELRTVCVEKRKTKGDNAVFTKSSV